jgi:hypothetical protein
MASGIVTLFVEYFFLRDVENNAAKKTRETPKVARRTRVASFRARALATHAITISVSFDQ